jgi:hypothetical protein
MFEIFFLLNYLAGAFPHSEPETQATEGFLQAHAPEIDAVFAVRN